MCLLMNQWWKQARNKIKKGYHFKNSSTANLYFIFRKIKKYMTRLFCRASINISIESHEYSFYTQFQLSKAIWTDMCCLDCILPCLLYVACILYFLYSIQTTYIRPYYLSGAEIIFLSYMQIIYKTKQKTNTLFANSRPRCLYRTKRKR